ncbi:hypothetical protein [Pelagicoccus sp. SDUM812005]|uniref:hypothetical protein n=1 Tax=Pelagicoccus sp. SDUM812005 TaxID=3041257 RepID=UPI00280C684E|nr:hypothetical protein [Pelagicoccus sp. SDUM812005]MDQ8182917.1 hypothetical protein [Pelagicoccus sp. SDUM812005]
MDKLNSRRNFLKKTVAASAGLSFTMTGIGTANAKGRSGALRWDRKGRRITVRMPAPSSVSTVEIRIHSSANDYIWEYSDISPDAPKVDHEQTRGVWMESFDKGIEELMNSSQEERFPTVDFVIQPRMEAVFEMKLKEAGEYEFNANGRKPLTEQIRIPDEQVGHWGNRFVQDPKTNKIEAFYMAAKVTKQDSEIEFEFDTLRDDWTGTVSVHDFESKKQLASVPVTWNQTLPKVSTGKGVSRERMIESLSWGTKYILECQDTNPDSDTYGGEFLHYDLAGKTRLRADWSWSWGPSARMLLNASRIEGVDAGMTSRQLMRRAIDLGYASMRQQILEPSHPAYGLVRTIGTEASTADSLFLVGWGWIPLYKATGDYRFLEAGKKVGDTCKKLLDKYNDVWLPQKYILEEKDWAKIMSFETSMGLPGLAHLYLETGEEVYRETMIRLADMLIRVFEREDGLWKVFYLEETGKAVPVNYWTKALGYVVDGLIEAHKAAPEKGYLEKGRRIADHVLKAQLPEGAWTLRFDREAQYVGICDKSTTLWAGMMIRLYKMTGNKAYYESGMRAIEWCMDHQYFGDDPVARGGFVAQNWASGINFRHWWPVVITYSVSFFGDAVSEALSLDEWK